MCVFLRNYHFKAAATFAPLSHFTRREYALSPSDMICFLTFTLNNKGSRPCVVRHCALCEGYVTFASHRISTVAKYYN
ncbi:hypothetical protein ACH3XW_34900 [Acanthocheilonema viteae]